MINLEIINDKKSFFDLKDEWNALLKSSNSDNIFLTWEWLYTWWESYEPGKELFIVTVKENGVLIGLAPLYYSEFVYFGIRALRHLEFLGSNDVCSEYLDFIILKDREQEVAGCILDSLFNNESLKWDVLNLVSVQRGSKNLIAVEKYLKTKNLEYQVYNKHSCPFVSLPTSMDKYYESLSKNLRMNLHRGRNKLFGNHKVDFKLIDDFEELEPYFEDFMKIHQKRQESKNEKGSFNRKRKQYVEFHKNISKMFFENKWLYLSFLTLKDSAIAAQYNFLYNRKLYYYSVGFDPTWSKYSVGNILLSMVIEDAINKKLSEFDFLRGEEDYKYRWAKNYRENLCIAIWRSKSVYATVRFEKNIRKLVKILLPKRIVLAMYNYFIKIQ